MLEGSPTDAIRSEEILADVVANQFRGIEPVVGRMKITSRRVLFEPGSLNFQNNPAEIFLSDIAEVVGLSRNRMLIRTKAGMEYKFVVRGRDKLISIIQSRLRNPA